MKLSKEYVFSKTKSKEGIRYDIHFKDKNVAYVLTKPSSEKDGAWVSGLHVLPSFQGKGLAKFLMKQVERFNRGKIIRLRARPYRDRGLKTKELVSFYLKLGYKISDKKNRMFKKIRRSTRVYS